MNHLDVIEQKLGEALGLRPRRGARSHLERAIERLRSDMGFSLEDIVQRIDTDPLLVRRLAGAVTVEETFFFRHPEHFDRLVEHVRAQMTRMSALPLVVWSAGCSSGEEPYSMAMALHRALGPSARHLVNIVASDVDEVSLEKARRGVYGSWSFRGTDKALRDAYFEPHGKDEHRVIASIREAVRFVHLTLEQQVATLPTASVDVVFFRNVAIYLTDAALESFFRGLARVMKDGALLVLGPADPIPTTVDLDHLRVNRGLGHARHLPSPGSVQVGTWDSSTKGIATGTPRQPTVTTPLPISLPTPLPAPVPAQSLDPKAIAHRAVELADKGRFHEAVQLLDDALAATGSNALLLGTRGRIHIAASSLDRGMEDLRSALFLSSTDLLLRFHYAIGLEMQKRHRIARNQVLDVLRALEASCDDDLLADGETTAGSLRRAAAELLRRIP